jgi:hypothetical protein
LTACRKGGHAHSGGRFEPVVDARTPESARPAASAGGRVFNDKEDGLVGSIDLHYDSYPDRYLSAA